MKYYRDFFTKLCNQYFKEVSAAKNPCWINACSADVWRRVLTMGSQQLNLTAAAWRAENEKTLLGWNALKNGALVYTTRHAILKRNVLISQAFLPTC